MVELSVVVPTIAENEEEIEVLRHLDRCSCNDYEVLTRRDEGASKARNEGIKRANAEKIVFLDDDSMPREGFLEAASEALDEHEAVTGRVFQPEDAPFGHLDLPWYNQGEEPKRTTQVVGCNMAIRKGLLEEVGGFNERYYHGHEETELAERINRDHDIFYVPEMVVDHYFADSVRNYWRKAYRHGKADMLQWEGQDLSWRELLWRSLPIPVPSTDVVRMISGVVRRLGRIRGLIADR